MKCLACGHSNPADLTRCASCGEELEDLEEATGMRPGAAAATSSEGDSPTEMRPSTGASQSTDAGRSGSDAPTDLKSASPALGSESPTDYRSSATFASSHPAEGSGELEAYHTFGSRFEVLQLLGEGGMGRVYKAWDRELERVVALKTIRGEMAQEPDILKRFKQELLLAQKITHKNVIRIHDMGEAEGVKFFTMEFIEGKSLKELVQEQGRLSPDQAVGIFRQVLSALEEAHSQGVVHRDLKPQNIMVDPDCGAHIMDFGIARSLLDTGMTATGMMIGTPDYMSPEQVQGQKADAQADVFSIGVILYEMLTGDLPYKGDTTASRVMARLSQKPRAPRQLNPEIPQYLENVVLKCMEADRALRYKSARAVLDDIERESVDRSVTLRMRRAVARRKSLIAAAVVTLLAVTIAVYYAARAGGPEVATAPSTTLAILPFNNASGDPGLDWLGPSLAEILTTEVGQTQSLRTVSPERVSQILSDLRIQPGSRIDPTTLTRVAEFSNADTVISGRYLKLGARIRIDAAVQNLQDGRNVSLSADAPNEDALLDTIRGLAGEVQANLGLSRDIVAELRAATFRPSSESIQALRFFNEGEELSRQGKHLEAVKQFESATEEDPEFALAWAALGQTYANLGYDYEADEHLRTAVELSADLPQQEKYLINAIQARIRKDFDKAIESYENLAEVMPENSEVQFRLAELYEDKGEYDRARELYSKVLNRDPNYLTALLAIGNLEIEAGKAQQAFEPLNQALSVAIQLGNKEAQGNSFFALGLAYSKLSRNEDALRYFRDALAAQTEVGDKRGMAEALKEIGKLDWAAGRVEEAQAEYEEALELQTEIGDRVGAARVLLTLGDIQDRQGDHLKALELFKESLKTLRELGDKHLEAICLSYIGSLYLDRGEFGEAQTYLELVLQIREELGSKGELSETVHNLGELALRTGRYNEAIDRYLRALELSRDAGDELGIAIESHSLGTAFAYQGRLGAALKAKEDAVRSLEKAGEGGFWRAAILSGYGDALNRIGKFDEGKKALEEALTLSRQLEIPMLEAQTLNFIGEGHFYQGAPEASRKPLEESLRVASAQQDQRLAFPARVNLARLELSDATGSSSLTSAIDTVRKLGREADAAGLKYYSVEATISIAQALLGVERYEEARQSLEDLLRETSRSGLRIHAAKTRFLLGEVSRQEGNEGEMRRHFRETARILEELKSEAETEAVLQRGDLAPLYEESGSWAPVESSSQ